MPFFHTHHWKVVSTDYTEPNTSVKLDGRGEMVARLLRESLCGTTHIYSKCISCGEIKQQDVIGKFVNNEQ